MKTIKKLGTITAASILLVAQYFLTFFVYGLGGILALQWLGWILWILSLVFGIGPIFILRSRGNVLEGQSYVHTRQLVDTGLYAIVRHPQYLAGILFSLALVLLSQHWVVILMGMISSGLIWLDIQGADQEGIDKFGRSYRDYMKRVPRANLLVGSIRILRSKMEKSKSSRT